MAEYYRAERKRTSAKTAVKTPYRKIFLRQLIAAMLCFLIINYTLSDNLKQTLKEAVNYNIDISEKFSFFNQIKINGADTNENETNVQSQKQ